MNKLVVYSAVGLTILSAVALMDWEMEPMGPLKLSPTKTAEQRKSDNIAYASVLTRDCIMDALAAEQGILIGRTADQMKTYWKQVGQYDQTKEMSMQLGFVMATMVHDKGYNIQQVYDSNTDSTWKTLTNACFSKASYQH